MNTRPTSRILATAIVAIVTATALLASGVTASANKGSMVCVGGRPACYTTIQAALAVAQNGATIQIGPGKFAGGITIGRSVHLVGAGAQQTVISGGGPVVTVGSKTSKPTVTISGLTVTGGVSSSDPQSPNCGPNLTTCGPGYTTATALGGGIETFPGSNVTISNSVVTGNRAAPSRSVTSVVATCAATTMCQTSQGAGGGIDDWGSMTLIDSQVTDNQASGINAEGGGIVVEKNAALSLQGSTVTGNAATSPAPDGRGAGGGGIFVDGGGGSSLTVAGSHVDDNRAAMANSIRAPYPEQGGSLDAAAVYSGGVFLADGSTATIRHSTLDGNTVTVDTPLGQSIGADAALCATGDTPLTIDSSIIDRNRVNDHALSGAVNGPNGDILEADANTTITNTQITGNAITVTTPTGDAAALGALNFIYGGTVPPTVTNTTISANTDEAIAPNGTATVQGAGLVNDGPLILKDVDITDNHATAIGKKGYAEGAGIWNGHLFGGPTSPLTIQNSHVTGNTLRGSPGFTLQGAAIYTLHFPTTLKNSLVADNTPDPCEGVSC